MLLDRRSMLSLSGVLLFSGATVILIGVLPASAQSFFPVGSVEAGRVPVPVLVPTYDIDSEARTHPQGSRSASEFARVDEGIVVVLPDAPSYSAQADEFPSSTPTQEGSEASTTQNSRRSRFAPTAIAPLYNKYIEEGQTAQPLLGARLKVLFGLDQMVSPYYLLSIVAAAGYEQALNGSPNYGTNIRAFGQRVGAAAATNASQSIFTDGVMPAVFRQDPRYYVKGRGHSPLARGAYAISRVFVTRSDSGENAPNYSLFAGHAATAALQNAYYPPTNQGATESAKSYANSFAGTALSNGIREFFPDLLHLAHLE